MKKKSFCWSCTKRLLLLTLSFFFFFIFVSFFFFPALMLLPPTLSFFFFFSVPREASTCRLLLSDHTTSIRAFFLDPQSCALWVTCTPPHQPSQAWISFKLLELWSCVMWLDNDHCNPWSNVKLSCHEFHLSSYSFDPVWCGLKMRVWACGLVGFDLLSFSNINLHLKQNIKFKLYKIK